MPRMTRRALAREDRKGEDRVINRERMAIVADAIEAGDGDITRPFVMRLTWVWNIGTGPHCHSPATILSWTLVTLLPPRIAPALINRPFDKAADLLGLNNTQANILFKPTPDVTGYNYDLESGDGHITRAHAVAALRDLAAGGACDDTLWKRTDPAACP